MSREAVQQVIEKAVVDSQFRESLFANPDKALTGYDLTAQETANLKSIDAESMESLAGGLDERISKAFIMGWTIGSGGGRKPGSKSTYGRRVGGPQEGW